MKTCTQTPIGANVLPKEKSSVQLMLKDILSQPNLWIYTSILQAISRRPLPVPVVNHESILLSQSPHHTMQLFSEFRFISHPVSFQVLEMRALHESCGCQPTNHDLAGSCHCYSRAPNYSICIWGEKGAQTLYFAADRFQLQIKFQYTTWIAHRAISHHNALLKTKLSWWLWLNVDFTIAEQFWKLPM